MTPKQWAILGTMLVALLALAGWSYMPKTPPVLVNTAGTASSTESGPVAATTTGAGVVMTGPFPLNKADTIASWNFKGSYAGNSVLTAQANADIAHLTSLIGKGEYDDYDLYLGIGNDEGLLGDGKSAYENYNRSISIHPSKGLAFVNLGHLMDQLGAHYTAADAYAKAVAVEPRMLEYHVQRLNYLTQQFANDNARIVAAFTDASKAFGDTPSILSIQARWLTEQKRYADAITAWQTVKMLSPGKDMTAVDTEIARLQAKQ